MKEFAPRGYTAFRCIAGACRHNCCIGWEIDIDASSLARYRAVKGEFGTRLRQNIAAENGCASFCLDAHERCPFLNKDNLCDIYLKLGEQALCQICTDHPRFRNFFSDRIEVGLGLCCEAAAKLLLCTDEPFSLILLSDSGEVQNPNAEEQAFFAFRDRLFALAQDRTLPLSKRLQNILHTTGAKMPPHAPKALADFYISLERLDSAWEIPLAALRVLPSEDFLFVFSKESEPFFENLLCCFLYRHLSGALEDENYTARAAFAVHAVQLILALYRAEKGKEKNFDFDFALELVRQYSSEIEYSKENLDAVLNLLDI